jgi:hypothetical protein
VEQHLFRERVPFSKFFQNFNISGITGFFPGLFLLGELQLFKEYPSKLFWRVEVEFLPGYFVYFLLNLPESG